MLRFFALLLILLNGLYFAWSQGLLQGLGFAPAQQTEPQRLNQQIKPEALRLLSAQEARLLGSAPRVASKPVECLQAGPFDERQGALLQQALEKSNLPTDAWVLETKITPARWIVYLGKFANAEALAKKRADLSSLKLKFQPLGNPALEPGLSVGRFETQAGANAARDALVRRGLRTARVVQEQAEVRGVVLRLPAADDSLRTRVNELKPALADQVLSRCQ
jgi:hypothetical protein